MIYLGTASTPRVRDVMAEGGDLGQMVTPAEGKAPVAGTAWALDAGTVKIIDGRPVNDPDWSPDKWRRTLDRWADRPGALFAVVPDVVLDPAGTLDRWGEYLSDVTERGYSPAFVTQDGCDDLPLDAAAVFTGGSDPWKLSLDALDLVSAAASRGVWTHCGRVNTLTRLGMAARDGYDSCDGTFLAFGPDVNLPRLQRFLRRVNSQRAMFGGET